MNDLISRQAAIEAIKRPHGGCYTEEAKSFAVYQVLSVPTADVVEVVRCKDCKHSSQKVHICELTNYLYGANYFCAWGERRDDE